MKKISLALTAAIIVISLFACGHRQETDPSITSIPPTTMPIIPEADPPLETNIPDPHINTEIPTYTDPIKEIIPDITN